MLQSMGLQRVGHDSATEQQQLPSRSLCFPWGRQIGVIWLGKEGKQVKGVDSNEEASWGVLTDRMAP